MGPTQTWALLSVRGLRQDGGPVTPTPGSSIEGAPQALVPALLLPRRSPGLQAEGVWQRRGSGPAWEGCDTVTVGCSRAAGPSQLGGALSSAGTVPIPRNPSLEKPMETSTSPPRGLHKGPSGTAASPSSKGGRRWLPGSSVHSEDPSAPHIHLTPLRKPECPRGRGRTSLELPRPYSKSPARTSAPGLALQ